jgi:hypothetical protein
VAHDDLAEQFPLKRVRNWDSWMERQGLMTEGLNMLIRHGCRWQRHERRALVAR